MGKIIVSSCLIIAILLVNITGSFVLLDPVTGREIKTNFPGSKSRIMELSPSIHQKSIMRPSQGARRRSDYISPSGTPLYKLRQRNPFGFGG